MSAPTSDPTDPRAERAAPLAPTDIPADLVAGELAFGLSWDKAKPGFFARLLGRREISDPDDPRHVDLDALAVLTGALGEALEVVNFARLASEEGAVRHGGDDDTGARDGADEELTIALARLRPEVRSVTLAVHVSSDHVFADAGDVACGLAPAGGGPALLSCKLTTRRWRDKRSFVLGRLERDGIGGWTLVPVFAASAGESLEDTLRLAREHA